MRSNHKMNFINETETEQKTETREELRKRLREKIKSKKGGRTNGINRRKGEDLNESLKKITEILVNKGIESPEDVNSETIETIMSVISKEDLQVIINKMKEDTKFKSLLEKVNNQN